MVYSNLSLKRSYLTLFIILVFSRTLTDFCCFEAFIVQAQTCDVFVISLVCCLSATLQRCYFSTAH